MYIERHPILVKNVIDPPKPIKICPELKGFFRCQRCLPCKVAKKQPRRKNTFKSCSDHKEYRINQLITCRSTYVTYVVECPCHFQYVGRTTRQLFVRIQEHIKNIRKGFPNHSLSRHFDEVHHRDPSVLTFYGIDSVQEHWRGGNRETAISRNETSWIYRLGSLAPKGLNLDIDLNCYIANP